MKCEVDGGDEEISRQRLRWRGATAKTNKKKGDDGVWCCRRQSLSINILNDTEI